MIARNKERKIKMEVSVSTVLMNYGHKSYFNVDKSKWEMSYSVEYDFFKTIN